MVLGDVVHSLMSYNLLSAEQKAKTTTSQILCLPWLSVTLEKVSSLLV